MPIDANIPLSVRPPQVEDPAQAYGRMLTLRNLQMQQEQQQRMAPLQYQQQQAITTEAQMRARQMEQAQRDQQQWMEDLRKEAAPRSEQPVAGSAAAPAAAAPAPLGVDASGRPTLLKAGEGDIDMPAPQADTEGAQPDAVVPAGSPPATAKAPAAQPQVAAPPIDYVGALDRSLQNGRISPAFHAQQMKLAIGHMEQLAKLNTAELKATNEKHDQYLGRLVAFRKMPEDYKQQHWADFNQQAYADKLLSPSEYQATIKQHPELPDDQTLDSYQLGLQTLSGQQKAALTMQQQAASKAAEAAHKSTTAKNEAELQGVQATAEEKKRQGVINQLVSAPTPERYNQVLTDNKVPHGVYPDASQVFDESGKARPDALQAINRGGMNPAQRATADAAGARNTQVQKHETEMAAIARDRNAIARDRAKKAPHETALQHKETISRLADQAIAESAQSGGGSVDDAISNVTNPGFYQNHPIGESRGEVTAELQRRKIAGPGGLEEQRRRAAIAKTQQDPVKALTEELMKPDPATAGKSGPPAAKKNSQTAVPPSGQITVRTPDGKLWKFDDEAHAKVFEDAVKRQSGTTQRVRY